MRSMVEGASVAKALVGARHEETVAVHLPGGRLIQIERSFLYSPLPPLHAAKPAQAAQACLR
jgi:hypothetical protein